MEFLVFYKHDDALIGTLNKEIMTGGALTKLIDESDFNPVEIIKILAIDDPENIFEVRYAGWQPGCIIDLIDNNGKIVFRGYGSDH